MINMTLIFQLLSMLQQNHVYTAQVNIRVQHVKVDVIYLMQWCVVGGDMALVRVQS